MESIAEPEVKTITLSGEPTKALLYDNNSSSLEKKESEYRFFYRFMSILMTILIFFILVDTTVNYVDLRNTP